MAPRVNKAYLAGKKDNVLQAAWVCFARKGFHQTTMEDVRKQAGVSAGAIYRHFKGKEQIIAAMTDRNRVESMAVVKNVVAKSSGDFHGALAEMADMFFGSIGKCVPGGMKVEVELWAESLRNPKILAEFRRNTQSHARAFAKIIRQAQRAGVFNPNVDARAVARAMISLFRGLILNMSMDGSKDVKKYLEVVKAMVGGLFTCQEGAGR